MPVPNHPAGGSFNRTRRGRANSRDDRLARSRKFKASRTADRIEQFSGSIVLLTREFAPWIKTAADKSWKRTSIRPGDWRRRSMTRKTTQSLKDLIEDLERRLRETE